MAMTIYLNKLNLQKVALLINLESTKLVGKDDLYFVIYCPSFSSVKNGLSDLFGLDIQIGSHVFQLVFSNAQPLTDANYITNATGDWRKMDTFFDFNLLRVF